MLSPVYASAGSAPLYLSSARQSDGTHALSGFDAAGSVLFTETLPGRGHDIAISPDRTTAIVFARRPGRFAFVFDCVRHVPVIEIEAAANRHFFGHGFFSADGKLLYATENAYDDEIGVIGVYDATSEFRRVNEFPTGGIGPHQAFLMPDGETIVIANGGILTHPDYGREKLNLATMEPSLCYLDRPTGNLLEKVVLPAVLHQLSIRHMALDRHGAVWFGCQYQGPLQDTPPLVGTHVRGSAPRLLKAPAQIMGNFRNYIGSVAANRTGNRIATTGPRGDVAVVWDVASRSLFHRYELTDVCGIAPDAGDGFLTTSGKGSIARNGADVIHYPSIAWDNHLTRF